ncbi:2-C-methyl-D-erythritol 4-phosphate cytidylyltransferase [Actinocatenispora comari]|jgi:2-C-methyl-D-erythritol 4-phosphate cytidylyltransferase|uniref:2-C-methyl-D-erythritol 4-phosphate cytidylyltransferase n=1 Tax=Actinocatenispora comari TaxID=2807577 RepID=A0A8J4AJ79_9ACTN|nr:2-C-methyl-D-erythritol 4-phosphate cytidylyltransferase [Actinocatenispora comari]GIL30332.1 2-C-methyl-D-erythritol 4-phosphate cytidylyltransferase [Actinocatenispora comari]
MNEDRDVTASRAGRGDVAVLVPAAGRGERLGPGLPKALRELAGSPLLVHAVRRLAQADCVGHVVVAVPAGAVDSVSALLTPVLAGTGVGLGLVVGGAERQQSVALALAAVPGGYPIILVHDAARAFAPPELVDRVAAAVRAGSDAVIPVLPVVDTIKQVDPDGAVTGTVDRSVLRAVQTPQGFRRTVLAAAHAVDTDGGATDDAGLVERLGGRVTTVPGAESALKITRPFDLQVAALLVDP